MLPIRSKMKPLTRKPTSACYSKSSEVIDAVVHVRGRQKIDPNNFSGEVSPGITIVRVRLLLTSFKFKVNRLG